MLLMPRPSLPCDLARSSEAVAACLADSEPDCRRAISRVPPFFFLQACQPSKHHEIKYQGVSKVWHRGTDHAQRCLGTLKPGMCLRTMHGNEIMGRPGHHNKLHRLKCSCSSSHWHQGVPPLHMLLSKLTRPIRLRGRLSKRYLNKIDNARLTQSGCILLAPAEDVVESECRRFKRPQLLKVISGESKHSMKQCE